MRKTDSILFALARLDKQLQGSDFGHHSVQFKIVCRLFGRQDEILEEENSLVNLIHALSQEIKAAQEESCI
jgi:hypothetical protein